MHHWIQHNFTYLQEVFFQDIYIFFIQQTLDNFKNPDTKEKKAERI